MDTQESNNSVHKFLSVFQYSKVALGIVGSTSAALTIVMAISTLVAGVLPAAIASVGGLFVDAVASALQQTGEVAEQAQSDLLFYVFLELGLVVIMTGAQKLNTV